MSLSAYYPYGEPTVEPKGQRFLFGGKEREHAGGRNAYDFGARSLTPYGSWPSPDPKAEDFYSTSPFSYCAGDPVNHIDKNGLETLSLLSRDSVSISTYVDNVPDNPKELTIYTHGNTHSMQDDTDPNSNLKKHGEEIQNAEDFINAVEQNSQEFMDIRHIKGLNINIKACYTGGDTSDGSQNIAAQISEKLPFSFVTAPTGKVVTSYKISADGKIHSLTEAVVEIDKGGHLIPMKQQTRTYFRGKEISPTQRLRLTKIIFGIDNSKIPVPQIRVIVVPKL